MKQRIRLNESQLREIVKESVKKVLNENSRNQAIQMCKQYGMSEDSLNFRLLQCYSVEDFENVLSNLSKQSLESIANNQDGVCKQLFEDDMQSCINFNQAIQNVMAFRGY